ncbi:BnaAnng38440D, partial [Brassica napus]
SIFRYQHHILHGKESVQEKRIFSQENKIQRLNYQVQDLRRQLVQCRNENQVKLTELITELDQLPQSGV